ncbi:MAG: single-stranded DNA-binding protein [Gammaproteobacteria bacterium]
MSNHFIGRGNLGANPDLKQITVEGEPRTVTELRVYFDRQVPDGNGGFEDRGGFWLPVHLWGPRGESVAKLLPKGARVRVEGTLVQDTWEDKDGETVSRIEVQADSIDLDLSRVEAVTFRAKGQAENGPSAEPQSQAKRQPAR